MKLHWYDSETTGLHVFEPHQMLTFAMVSTDLQGSTLNIFNERLRLRPDVNPTREALAVNRLDPLSPDWHASAQDENVFCDRFITYLDQNYKAGDVIIAYSAPFVKGTMERHKKFLELNNNAICVDPLIMARQATKAGKIIVPFRPVRYGGGAPVMTPVSTLDAVSNALGTLCGPAHTALGDVHTMIKTTPAAYNVLCGQNLEHFVKQNQYRVKF
jgi:oligoribonuclease (3'-5' exoribonuclease)